MGPKMTNEHRAKLVQLIERLEFGTRSGQIEWESTDRKYAFVYSTPSSSVIVASIDADGQIPIEMQVLNDRGEVIESMTSHAMRENRYIPREGGRALASLYEQARRFAMGV